MGTWDMPIFGHKTKEGTPQEQLSLGAGGTVCLLSDMQVCWPGDVWLPELTWVGL